MTSPFSAIVPAASGDEDRFDPKKTQGNLLIIRVFDAPDHVITSFRPDGLVHWKTKDGEEKTMPNTAVRVAVADVENDKVYPLAWIYPSSLVKEMKTWVDQGPKLLVWNQDNPEVQTSPYRIMDMSGKALFVKQATAWLAEHPDFLELPAPEKWDPAAQKKVETLEATTAAPAAQTAADGSFFASLETQRATGSDDPPF